MRWLQVFSNRNKLLAASATCALFAASAALGPVVRHQVAQTAAHYGADVSSVDQVRPTLGGVRLRGVNLTLRGVPATSIHLDELAVAYGASGRKLSFQGGVVRAVGPREVLLDQLNAWRARYWAPRAAAAEPAGRPRSSTELPPLRVIWQNDPLHPTESASVDGLRVVREPGRLTVRFVEGAATMSRSTLSVTNGRVELKQSASSGYRLAVLAADVVEAETSLSADKRTDLSPRAEVASSRGAASRATLVALAQALDLALDPGGKIHLGSVHARVRRGSDVLNVGPGTLDVAVVDQRVVVELVPNLRGASTKVAEDAAREEALTFRLAVPLADAITQEIVADVQGGPIWLSSLGIRDDDFGLFDVGQSSLTTRSHLVLSGDGRSLRVDGEGKLHALSLRNAALSDEPVAGLELAFALKGEFDLDGTRARVAEGEVDLGAIRLLFKGDYDRVRGAEDTYRVRGSFDMPITACQSMLDSTPKGLIPKLHGLRMAGSFALRGRANVDTAHLDRDFRLTWDATNSCRIVDAPPSISVARFRAPFSRTAYDPQGRPVAIETGPGTSSWVPIGAISKFMEVAVLSTEDGAFLRHQGFDHEAIRNSIRENLRQKKFVRGASTISMQLAKNLYLDRGKNLSRKLQEAVLTMYLEQELTKEQIMELYLNVVEFGPMVYGVGPAAHHYFDTSASELSLGQALYISSIMPNPKVQHFGAGGAVSHGWMNFLYKLMKNARDRNRIGEDELQEGLRETVIRGGPPQRSARPLVEPVAPTVPESVDAPPIDVWP